MITLYGHRALAPEQSLRTPLPAESSMHGLQRPEDEYHEMRIDVPPPRSPQPTEKAYNPDEPDNQQEYCVERLRNLGIHARHFAFKSYPND